MHRLFTRVTLTCVSLLCHVGLFSAEIHAQSSPPKPISWVNADVPGGKGLKHKVLASKSLGHDVGYVVWTPPRFDDSGETRYPVVYFLHGASGTETSDAHGFSSILAGAIRKGIVPPAICVFPNGGLSGYRGEVESMIVDELIPLIDSVYPTKATASGRVAVGFSMGGAGSVRLSLLHPDLFCAAGSWGGALMFRGNPAESPLLPAAKANAAILKKNHFVALLINGDKDRPDAFKLLAETLEPLGVDHTVVVLEDTQHNLGQYHSKSGAAMAKFIGDRLKRAAVN